MPAPINLSCYTAISNGTFHSKDDSNCRFWHLIFQWICLNGQEYHPDNVVKVFYILYAYFFQPMITLVEFCLLENPLFISLK